MLPEEKEMLELKIDDESPEFKTKPILIGKNKEGSDEFCKDCPIPQGVSRITFSIPFEVECGMDNVCYSDLQVNGDIPQLRESSKEKNISYVIGSSDILKLKLLVSNKKTSELAYLTRLYIELGDPARISQINSLCRESFQLPSLTDLFNFNKSSQNRTSNSTDVPSDSYKKRNEGTYITCDLDNPLQENTEREVLLGIDMSNAKGSKGMIVRAWATTSSIEKNPFDNVWELYIPFHSEADVTITGATDNEMYTYYKGNKESEEKINFINIYEVRKIGPSPLDKVEIEIQIPRAITDGKGIKFTSFLSIIKLETKQEEQPLICKQFKKSAYTHLKGDHEIINTWNKDVSNNLTISMTGNSTDLPKVQRNDTLFINCSSNQINKDNYIECATIRCEAGPFLTSLIDATVYLHLQLNAKALYRVMGSRKAISIGTTGFVKVKDPPDLIQPILEKLVSLKGIRKERWRDCINSSFKMRGMRIKEGISNVNKLL
ncbi:hypothetical protein J437_LFUL007501 [Ladona fulva]|uniref:Uncharacterized protein n=1 Tax=Ladona fulva TaxID=123851 RepID=A0A8K0KI73_LADFU|nr:hypothetical protein J437_LFUL007501 [Ladona fulva]